MKRTKIKAGLLLRAFFLVLSIPGMSRGIPAQNQYDKFVKRFDQAVKTEDRRALKRILKSYPTECIQHFRILIDAYVNGGDSSAGDRIEDLKDVWNEVWKCKVLERVEKFQSALDGEQRRLVARLKNERQRAWGAFEAAKKSKKREDFDLARENMAKVAEAFENMGDNLEAAESYIYLASILYFSPKKTDADWNALLGVMEKYESLHKAWDWTQGRTYKSNVGWIKRIRQDLKSGVKPGEEEKKKQDPAGGKKQPENLAKFLKGSKWTKVDLLLGIQKKLENGVSMFASAWPLEWQAMSLKGTLPEQMKSFQDGTLFLQRSGASKYLALLDPADPKSGKLLKFGGGKPKALFVPYKKEGADYLPEYAFWFWTGGAQESIAGTDLNLAPQWGQQKSALVFYRSAAILSGKVEGVNIELYDEDFNGVVGEVPGKTVFGDMRFGTGEEKAEGVPVIDSMRVGGSKHLIPYSKYFKIKDQWYRFQVTGNNEQLRYRPLDPATVPTGRVAFQWRGPGRAKPDHLVIRETTWFRGAAFDIARAGKKGIEVPAGDYEILYGRIMNGSPPRVNNAVILKGKSKNFKVEKGKTVTLTLGAPFHLEFEVVNEGGYASVSSATFWVRGAFGEKYGAIVAEVLEPVLYASKNPDGKGAKKVGVWRRCEGYEINALRDRYQRIYILHLACMPIDKESAKQPNLSIRVKRPRSGTFFLGVQQRGHKLFGKLLPIWK